jgi:hypothetical protein
MLPCWSLVVLYPASSSSLMVRALDCIASVFSSPAMQAMRRDEDECERATGWIMDARDWVELFRHFFYIGDRNIFGAELCVYIQYCCL